MCACISIAMNYTLCRVFIQNKACEAKAKRRKVAIRALISSSSFLVSRFTVNRQMRCL